MRRFGGDSYALGRLAERMRLPTIQEMAGSMPELAETEDQEITRLRREVRVLKRALLERAMLGVDYHSRRPADELNREAHNLYEQWVAEAEEQE